MTDYWNLNETEAEAALQEFLDERGPALERLRQALVADGQNPDKLLDDTVKSLRRLWPWMKPLLTERPPEEMDLIAPDAPSWERYCVGNKPTLSRESTVIVDGLISYVCRLVELGAPHARWRVGHRPDSSWVWENHPVLSAGDGGWALGELTQRPAQPIGGRILLEDNMMALKVEAYIDHLHRVANPPVDDEPLVEVEDLGDDPVRGRELEVSLHEEVAHRFSRQVDRMVKKLAKEKGISGVIREDREVLLVATPTWGTAKLLEWVTRYLEAKIRH